MTDEAALLAAVIAHPDDDTPRLVYADWCDDQGEPGWDARAAFIRASVALARAGGRAPKPGEFLCRKPKARPIVVDDAVVYAQPVIEHVIEGPCRECDWCALTRQATDAWLGMPGEHKYIRGGDGVAAWIVRFDEPRQWARGFPEVCRELHSTFWRDHHAELRAAAPIRRVELLDAPDVQFGPTEIQTTTNRNGEEERVVSWEATWGDRRDRFALKLTIGREVIALGGEQAVERLRARQDQQVAASRELPCYLKARWPTVEFDMRGLMWRTGRGEPDYRTFLRQMDADIFRSLAALEPRAFINTRVD